MTLTDRLTRTTAARVVWGSLVVLSLAGWWLARAEVRTAVDAALPAAITRATSIAALPEVGSAITANGTATVSAKAFREALKDDLRSDPAVIRVRVWASGGSLILSTDPSDRAGTKMAPPVGLSEILAGATTALRPRSTAQVQALAPVRNSARAQPVAAIEVDLRYEALLGVAGAWGRYAWLLAIVAIPAAAMFVVSMARRPKRRRRPSRSGVGEAAFRAGWGASPASDPLSSDTVEDVRPEEVPDEYVKQEEAPPEPASTPEPTLPRDPEVDGLRAKVAEAEARAAEAEEELARLRAEAEAAREARAAGDPDPVSTEPVALPEPHDSISDADPFEPIDLLAVLEAKVAEAERRAIRARDEAQQLTPEAADLRRRLARTAARKKLGPTG